MLYITNSEKPAFITSNSGKVDIYLCHNIDIYLNGHQVVKAIKGSSSLQLPGVFPEVLVYIEQTINIPIYVCIAKVGRIIIRTDVGLIQGTCTVLSYIKNDYIYTSQPQTIIYPINFIDAKIINIDKLAKNVTIPSTTRMIKCSSNTKIQWPKFLTGSSLLRSDIINNIWDYDEYNMHCNKCDCMHSVCECVITKDMILNISGIFKQSVIGVLPRYVTELGITLYLVPNKLTNPYWNTIPTQIEIDINKQDINTATLSPVVTVLSMVFELVSRIGTYNNAKYTYDFRSKTIESLLIDLSHINSCTNCTITIYSDAKVIDIYGYEYNDIKLILRCPSSSNVNYMNVGNFEIITWNILGVPLGKYITVIDESHIPLYIPDNNPLTVNGSLFKARLLKSL